MFVDHKRRFWLLGLIVPLLPFGAFFLVRATGLGLFWWFGPIFVYGVIPVLERRYTEADSDSQRERLEQYMREVACRACKGARLKPESLAVTLGGLNIWELTRQSIRDELRFLEHIDLTEREHMIAERMLKEIRARLHARLAEASSTGSAGDDD